MKSKFVIFVTIGTLLIAAIYSSSMSVVFAKPPLTGYVTSCEQTFYKSGTLKSQTCCRQYYLDGKENGELICKKTCFARDGEDITCPKRTAEEGMVDPGLLDGGLLKDGGTNDTGNNTKVGPSSPLVDRNESP